MADRFDAKVWGRSMRKNERGAALVFFAVVVYVLGTKGVATIQMTALLTPAQVLPLALCVTVPALALLFKGVHLLARKPVPIKIKN